MRYDANSQDDELSFFSTMLRCQVQCYLGWWKRAFCGRRQIRNTFDADSVYMTCVQRVDIVSRAQAGCAEKQRHRQ
ncbi:hypothetical protein [Roseinatronobacter thiooxidans]|uniref:hypothetical protein n=1 Tax=Roseinatronobacter thiooxidans TaxID=121821 RepID=UPI001160C3C7|nr:hypothetical protein [Roseinatronobacter thiooxidans]